MQIHLLGLFITICVLFVGAQQPGGGGFDLKQEFACLTDDQRAAILQDIEESRARLRAEGKLAIPDAEAIVLLDFPIAGAEGQTDYGYHGISNFVDQNPAFPDQLLDWLCGNRTYDLSSGYNHQGTDYFSWPFSWQRMDNDEIIIVAAAAGTIIFRGDGSYDRNCGFNASPWNAVYVEHADGSVAWYGHMKNGSVTEKTVGESVETGEYLGVVGSSGSSTGPHLHFEVYDSTNSLIDPYSGICNSMNEESWWLETPEYYDSAINVLMTHDAPPIFPECPQPEVINERNSFMPEETIYTAVYYRDQLGSQTTEYTIYRPDSSVFQNWTHNSPAVHWAASYWYWWWNLPASAQEGVWTFEAVFEGETYVHNFTVGTTDIEDSELLQPLGFALEQNYPNPFNPSTTIRYSVTAISEVSLKIYDSSGRLARELVNGSVSAGSHEVVWNGADHYGKPVASGVYYYVLSYTAANSTFGMGSGAEVLTRKMLLVR